MNILKLYKILLWFICLLVISQAGIASYSKIIVVTANGASFSDIADKPNIKKMMSCGAAGLISPNVNEKKDLASMILSAGAGGSVKGASIREVYNFDEITEDDEIAADMYRTRMRKDVPDGSALVTNIGMVLRVNEDLEYVRIGALGDALQSAGLKSCAVGTSDKYPNIVDRSSAALAMNRWGIIDIGRLSEENQSFEPVWDISTLVESVSIAVSEADFIVVNFGDIKRTDNLKDELSEDIYATYRSKAINNLDMLIGELMNQSFAKDCGIILASFEPLNSGKWQSLPPIVFYNIFGSSGVLSSSTTKTNGLVAVTDFAPTIISLFNIEAKNPLMGQLMYKSDGNVSDIVDLDKRTTAHQLAAPSLLWCIVLLGAIVLTLSVVAMCFGIEIKPFVISLFKGVILFDMVSGTAMLIAVSLGNQALSYTLWTIALGIGISLMCWLLGKCFNKIEASPVILAFIFTSLLIVFDAFSAGRLCRFAAPSFYQFSGLRFYGIGNEYGAMLISMTALASIMLARAYKIKWISILPLLLFVPALGIGTFGANNGATIAGIVMFGLVALALFKGEFKWWHILFIGIAAVGVVAAFATVDLAVAGEDASHAGRAAGVLKNWGIIYLISIVLRKMLYNLQIMVSGNGVYVFSAFIVPICLWLWRLNARINSWLDSDRFTKAALKAFMYGCGVAFLCNDSGVTMAAIMLAMFVGTFIYMLLDEEYKKCRK